MSFYSPFAPNRRLARTFTLAGVAGYALPALAQTAGSCQISIGYGAAAVAGSTPTAVPGLTLLSVGILAASLGVLAWHKRPGASKMLALALWTSAGVLGMEGGNGVIQAVRAAGPYEFSNPSGGSVVDNAIAYSSPAPLITITNTSGVAVKITSNANISESGSCTVGSQIAPGAACTTSAVCSGPPPQLLSVVTEPTVDCDFSQPPLYTQTSSSANGNLTFAIYPPMLTSNPVFNPGSVSVPSNFSYTPGPQLIIDQSTGQPTNANQASAGIATVTSQAPTGYAFDNSNPPATTRTWNLAYGGCIRNTGNGNGNNGNNGNG